jgi:ubiquinone/menaquinone biosynthesis C-methylase UbiE
MQPERRFNGAMSLEYQLVRLAIPHFDELQRRVAETVADYSSAGVSPPLRVLDLGCGDGITSATLLARRPDIELTALDNEERMIARAAENLRTAIHERRCQLVQRDALVYLRDQVDSPFDIVASALALHNLHHDYRRSLHEAIYQALKPGGLFVNADKYAQDDAQRFAGLRVSLERFFDLLAPLGKLELLRECVLHNVGDEEPERVMREHETVLELSAIGFRDIEIRGRYDAAALLVANKPG